MLLVRFSDQKFAPGQAELTERTSDPPHSCPEPRVRITLQLVQNELLVQEGHEQVYVSSEVFGSEVRPRTSGTY